MKNPMLEAVAKAAENLQSVVSKTPLQFSKRLSEKYHASIYLKREDLQEVRSFKIRGAYNKMVSLTAEEKKRGVVCASAGNHAQGVAYSCSKLKIHGVIFMPTVTPNQKIEKVKHFGGKYITIELVGNTFDDASHAAQEFCRRKKAIYVHPFDDPLTIAGQGTVGKESYEDLDGKLAIILVPIGGGGLASGVSSYIKEQESSIQVYGIEPEGAAGMHTSINKKQVTSLSSIDTFVDGAAVKTVGSLTYELCAKNLDELYVIPEGKICTTMIELYQLDGIITEPAGALTVAALDEVKDKIAGKTVVCVISGGNNDLLRYPEILERSLVYQGKKHYLLVEFAQKPGQLRSFVDKALGPTDDIVRFEYIKKTNKEKGPALIGIELLDKADFPLLLKRMDDIGIQYRVLAEDDLLYTYLI